MRYHLILLSTLLLANGCFFLPSWGDDYYDDDSWDGYDEVHEVDGQISEAWLGGEMRDLGTFEGEVYEAEYVGGYGSSTITLHAGQNGGDEFGWAMIGLTTYAEGGFEGDAFAPGSTVTLEDGQVDAQGCTGPEHGDWDFDGYAEVVEITVEEGPTPSSRLFHFRAVYTQDDGGTTEGSFVLELPDDGTGGTVRN